MCKALSEGGQRCASHTRGPATDALARIDAGGASNVTDDDRDALADYASTPTGREELSQTLAATRAAQSLENTPAELEELIHREAVLEHAIEQGDQMREATTRAREQLRAEAREYIEKLETFDNNLAQKQMNAANDLIKRKSEGLNIPLYSEQETRNELYAFRNRTMHLMDNGILPKGSTEEPGFSEAFEMHMTKKAAERVAYARAENAKNTRRNVIKEGKVTERLRQVVGPQDRLTDCHTSNRDDSQHIAFVERQDRTTAVLTFSTNSDGYIDSRGITVRNWPDMRSGYSDFLNKAAD